jgi:putative ABC transport system substrate-binding protein
VAERFPDLIAELIRLKVDIIVVISAAGAVAAKKAEIATPVVFAAVTDPIGLGIIGTLARPGGNLTGTSLGVGEGFSGKWVELLKETVPKIARVAVLRNPTHPVSGVFLRETQAAGRALGVKLESFEARDPGQLDSAFSRMEKARQPAGRAADEVRVRDQPANGEGAGTDDSALDPDPGGPRHRVATAGPRRGSVSTLSAPSSAR